MKLNKWSILKTRDEMGLAIKPPEGNAHHYEVCVAHRYGRLEINVYVDGIVLPVATMTLPTKPSSGE
jgi:hypothetical protein